MVKVANGSLRFGLTASVSAEGFPLDDNLNMLRFERAKFYPPSVDHPGYEKIPIQRVAYQVPGLQHSWGVAVTASSQQFGMVHSLSMFASTSYYPGSRITNHRAVRIIGEFDKTLDVICHEHDARKLMKGKIQVGIKRPFNVELGEPHGVWEFQEEKRWTDRYTNGVLIVEGDLHTYDPLSQPAFDKRMTEAYERVTRLASETLLSRRTRSEDFSQDNRRRTSFAKLR